MEDLLHNMSAAESTVITEQEKTNFVINVNDIWFYERNLTRGWKWVFMYKKCKKKMINYIIIV